jgi:hypothetical protein
MAENVPQFQGLSLSKIGDLGVKLEAVTSATPVTASA